MNLTIRLYKMIDNDLFTLAQYEDFSVIGVAKYCLESFVEGKACRIAFPKGRMNYRPVNKSTYTYIITLNEKKDEKIIKLLANVKNRYRNSFVKNLIRGYLEAPFMSSYLMEPEAAQRCTEAFRKTLSWDNVVAPPAKKKTEIMISDQIKTANNTTQKIPKKSVVKKKSAIDALGSIMIAPREKDDDLASSKIVPNNGTIEDAISENMPNIPVYGIKQETDTHTVKEPVHKHANTASNSFDLFDAVSGMMTEY